MWGCMIGQFKTIFFSPKSRSTHPLHLFNSLLLLVWSIIISKRRMFDSYNVVAVEATPKVPFTAKGQVHH